MGPADVQRWWITGASAGIGRALALEALKRGHFVIVSARRTELLEELREQSDAPSRVLVVGLDVSDENSIAAAVEAAGEVDVLVNNAGVSQRATALETSMSDVRRLVEVNLIGPIALTRAVVPQMIDRGRGRIVIVSSMAGYVATPKRSTYAATKFGVRGFFDSLRAELTGTGVGVTVVCPGYVDTEISTHAVGADGTAHGRSDKRNAAGIDAAKCARKMARAIEKGKREVWIGGPEIYAGYLARFMPGIVARLLPRVDAG